MAELIKIYEENPNERELEKVVDVLKKGGLIIYPTDTVYGLGCDITNLKALERVAQIKNVKLEKSNFSFVRNFFTIFATNHFLNYIYTALNHNALCIAQCVQGICLDLD